jgi:HEAT repeat protein
MQQPPKKPDPALPDRPAALARALDERLRRHDAEGAAAVARRDDARAVRAIVRALGDPDPATADAAAHALMWFRRDLVAGRLEEALAEESLRHRAAAALAVLVGDATVAPLLVGLTRDRVPPSGRALHAVSDDVHVTGAVLAGLSHDRDPIVRRLAIDRLVDVDEPTAARALRQALHDPSPTVRGAAADALEQRRRRFRRP